MSLLDRLGGRHLDDAALAAIWTRTAESHGSAPAVAGDDAHLAACVECRVRFDAFASWMQDIAADVRLEADHAFPPERLAAQQAAILRRLEAAERPARVIAFPKFNASAVSRSTPVRRWVAAAAAAGLMVGVGLGQLMDLRHLGTDPRAFERVQQTRADTAARGTLPVSIAVSEEALLMELEAAATPQYEALRAYDTVTPRAADFLLTPR